MTTIEPFRLAPRFAERVWGRRSLEPWYGHAFTREPIGEAWLTGPECMVETGSASGRTLADVWPGGDFPLLVKLLFPDDRLSVQVHPDDAQAQAIGVSRGKTECWYVLEATEGAAVACGLKPGCTVADLTHAIERERVETVLEQIPVGVGDMVFVDAGTVHAIGEGVVLLEVQQTCDITYRLFDYGRGRELHLEAGLAVVKPATRAGKIPARPMHGFTRLIEEQYFTVDRFELAAGGEAQIVFDGPGCLVGLAGQASAGSVPFGRGQAVVTQAGTLQVSSVAGATFVRCQAPAATSTAS